MQDGCPEYHAEQGHYPVKVTVDRREVDEEYGPETQRWCVELPPANDAGSYRHRRGSGVLQDQPGARCRTRARDVDRDDLGRVHDGVVDVRAVADELHAGQEVAMPGELVYH